MRMVELSEVERVSSLRTTRDPGTIFMQASYGILPNFNSVTSATRKQRFVRPGSHHQKNQHSDKQQTKAALPPQDQPSPYSRKQDQQRRAGLKDKTNNKGHAQHQAKPCEISKPPSFQQPGQRIDHPEPHPTDQDHQ